MDDGGGLELLRHFGSSRYDMNMPRPCRIHDPLQTFPHFGTLSTAKMTHSSMRYYPSVVPG